MKKIILLFAFFSLYGIGFGQKLIENRAKYFTEAAAKEFNLNNEQKKELQTSRMDYLKSMAASNQQAKNGEITEAEKQSKTKEKNQKFKNIMEKLTGKKPAELEPFYVRMREELQNIK